VHVYSLPSLSPIGLFGEGVLGEGETNLGMLEHSNGERWVLVTDDHVVRAYNSDTYSLELELTPDVEYIEEVLGDAYHQVIYVPDEMGGDSTHGEGILAFHTDGTAYTKDGTNEFGTDAFESDEEGILLYTCPHDGEEDDGRGFIVVADQRSNATDFEVFDRLTWVHLGRFRVEEVSGTDGIGSTQIALPGYPLGLFAAVDADSSVKLVSWETIIQATGLECDP
jgi:hypothetical protein